MNHDALVAAILGMHTPLLAVLVAAYYKYGDRTDNISKALQGTDSLLAKLRRRLADELHGHVGPVVTASITQTTTSILLADGSSYQEKPPNITEGEGFRECLHEFMDSESELVADLGLGTKARNAWCWWAQVLSWVLLGYLIWDVLVLGVVFLAEKALGYALQEGLLHSTWIGTAILAAVCFGVLGFMQRKHDVLCDLRIKYDSP